LTIQGQAIQAACSSASMLLPIEIAFLARHGIEPDTLDRAALIARSVGVSADEALLKTGLVEEERVYRALARELGLPFLQGEFEVDAVARFPESILLGIAPLASPSSATRFCLAPSGDRLAWLLVERRRFEAGLAVVTPAALRRAVFRARARAIAEHAADGLGKAEPGLSCKAGLTVLQGLFAIVVVLIVALLAATGPGMSLTSFEILLGLTFLAMVRPRLAAPFERSAISAPRRPPRRNDRDLPVYTIIVPLYREARVLPRLIQALSALDYPGIRAQTPQAF
jgi:hypothetical protein